jgi:hypothetical protein
VRCLLGHVEPLCDDVLWSTRSGRPRRANEFRPPHRLRARLAPNGLDNLIWIKKNLPRRDAVIASILVVSRAIARADGARSSLRIGSAFVEIPFVD